MELFGSFFMFLFFIVVYGIIVDVFIVLFRFTGISEEKARFQVISMLTNSGYTTRESEMFTKSKLRRRLARVTMMFGYAFTVTIVSSMVNVFIQIKDINQLSSVTIVPATIVVAALIWFSRKNKTVRLVLNRKIEQVARRVMFKGGKNPIMIIDEYDDMIIAEIEMRTLPEILVSNDIVSSRLKEDYGIMGLVIRTKDGDERQIHADTVVVEGDIIVVMGREQDIRRVLGGIAQNVVK